MLLIERNFIFLPFINEFSKKTVFQFFIKKQITETLIELVTTTIELQANLTSFERIKDDSNTVFEVKNLLFKVLTKILGHGGKIIDVSTLPLESFLEYFNCFSYLGRMEK